MKDQAELVRVFEEVAREALRSAPSSVEARVIAGFRAQRARRRFIRASWASAAAGLLLAIAWFFARHAAPALHAQATQAAAENGFVALPYAQSDVPLEEAVVVRVKLNASQLEVMGVPGAWTNADGNMSADVLVGQDGVARAVRLVQ